ncbi:MAG: hypothetical protein ACREXX_23255 [Gammaproteobacteria bacterium]
MKARPGWEAGQIIIIESADILQLEPAALTDGGRQLHAIIRQWAEAQA